jgi:hypothetical protein
MTTPKVSNVIQHGTKSWSHLTSDNERELERFAERLRTEVKGEGNGKGEHRHLDLTIHQRDLALRYGAESEEE